MTKRMKVTMVATAIALMAGCGDELPAGLDAAPCIEESRAPATMAQLFEQIGPPRRTHTVDAAAGARIRLDAMAFTIPGGAITDRSGTPADVDTDGDGVVDSRRVTGPVTIVTRELASIGDMVRADRAPVGPGGRLLESSGAFELDAFSADGRLLAIQQLAEVTFERWEDGNQEVMSPWVADAAGDVWAQPDALGRIETRVANDVFTFPAFPYWSLGKYRAVNCDQLTNLAAAYMTLRVKLDPTFTAEAGVFFLPDGFNTAVKLYSVDANLPGFRSYPASMPVGLAGKLVVVALRDGKYHLYHDEAFVIPAGTPGIGGVNEATLAVTPVEVSEADFTAYIDSL